MRCRDFAGHFRVRNGIVAGVLAAISATSAAHAQERGGPQARLDVAAGARNVGAEQSGVEVAFYSATGLFGQRTRVLAGSEAGSGVGGGFWFSTAYYGSQVVPPGGIGAAVRSHLLAGLGVGSQGFEGVADFDLMGGHRWAVGAQHGPLVRYGLRGLLEGDRIFYASRLELPALALGYQYFTKALLVELLGRGSAVLVGRYSAGEAPSRRLGNALGWGGQATLFWHEVGLELRALRIELAKPVSVLEARLCSGALALLVCSSFARHAGDVEGLDTSAVVSTLSVGAAVQGRSGR